ncbi:hypothetical protein WMO13_06710 [Ignatzschineria larvae DSM 13226]|uniref:Uncharacterized protein n=1 Tax=Ignatzschineria larvae DSM 13226 TaxID=1111732 RepID=A0ABZ3BXF9_9GAMM|nr:hypothetical protein [Ignatzschineria larvae]
MKKIIEVILIFFNERKEARLYREWARNREDQQHSKMLEEAEVLASRPSYRPAESVELKKVA